VKVPLVGTGATVAVYVTAAPAVTGLRLDTTLVAVVAWVMVSVAEDAVLGSTVLVPEKIAPMVRAPTVVNDVVQDATPDTTATVSHPEIDALFAVNATVPADPDGETVAVKVTDAVASAAVGDSTSAVVEGVEAATGATVTLPSPVRPAPRNLVESAVAIAHDEPPPPPPPGIFMPPPSAPPPPPK
jgi:hypothetical protein